MALVPPNTNRGGYPLALEGATEATRYVGATAAGAPASGSFAVGDLAVDQTGSLYVCTVAGSPGTWVAIGTGLGASTDGWVDDSAAIWTRTANQTFTVGGDRTTTFTKGTYLRWTQTTVKYGVVTASSHVAGTTTVTIATNTDHVLTAAAISANGYSYGANPQGWPTWFNYAPTNETGWSDANPFTDARFCVIGALCMLHINASGTSDATTTTFDAPIAAADTSVPFQATAITNNGTAAFGRFYFASATQIKVGVSATSDTWTGSGTKSVTLDFAYMI